MADIQFQQVKLLNGSIDPDIIKYTDPNGQVWMVARDTWQWRDIYEPWLAAGNTPLPPA